MSVFIELPMGASPTWKAPVDLLADLPAIDLVGAVRLVESDDSLYWFDGTSWLPIQATSTFNANDTNSVDMTYAAPNLSAVVKISSNAADASNLLVPIDIQTTGVTGLRAQVPETTIRGAFSATAPLSYNNSTGVSSIPVATTSANGYLSSTDWTTFNNKQDNITAGTTADFYRGDKTFQTLQMSALTAVTNGAAAASGKIGEIISSEVASFTGTGLGATGVWGSVTSISLTAGAWMVSGVVGFGLGTADLTTGFFAGLSDSASGVGIGDFNQSVNTYILSGSDNSQLTTPPLFVDISATTSYYLNSKFYYTSGAPEHRGKIQAIRIR